MNIVTPRGTMLRGGHATVTTERMNIVTPRGTMLRGGIRCEVGVGITESAIGVGKSESEDRDRRVGVGAMTAQDKEGSGYAGYNGGCQGNADTRPTNSRPGVR
ncbi:MAG: hypothetical protein M1816_002611 [Peltula sp. TS41687]|nr:MAG: hypothetical protein M1816_002611 [Peltula sp. TS41687]